MLPADQLAEALQACPPETFRGTLYRAVNLQYLSSLTSGVSALRAANRYGPPGLTEALYMAVTPDLAMVEANQQYRHEFHMDVIPATAILPVDVDVRRVLDLTRRENQQALGTTVAELTGQWRVEYGAQLEELAKSKADPHRQVKVVRVPTHDIGKAAYEAGFDAIRYESCYAGHRQTNRENYVVFLRSGQPAPKFQLHEDVLRAAEWLAKDQAKRERAERHATRAAQRRSKT
ncbi:hypothetical protein GCM10008959_31480 [Deinococcus seoulensis]|uniref:RES domain-containing protein n=1 Tax=Deinococcus seoulensis TaxID=1837379 RepID=A0ABQ2RXZ7_9DEIO|nr:RES family NAD+ phosphorylase [Deinococcus seoulensis]GGR67009.1 hypothetical protein GCM10008959_31480 [Deinococcus seoulensis]